MAVRRCTGGMKRIGVLLVVALSACASASSQPPPADPAPVSAAPPVSGVAVVETTDGLAGVGVGPGTKAGPRWSYGNAAAAPDGSAVFAAEGTARVPVRMVYRVDPRTGHIDGVWTVAGSPRVDAAAPDGRWVALTERSPDSDTTVLTVLDPATGESRRHRLQGDVEAEAFTVDGDHLFVIRHLAHHYRVELVTVATGEQQQTLSRDKKPGADMTGGRVAAVLSPDRSVLATLYRNPAGTAGHPGHVGSSPAFVHLADLQHGWTYCVDLPAPFGTGPAGDDVIVADGTDVVVGATAAGRVARIDAASVHSTEVFRPVGFTVGEGTVAGPPPVIGVETVDRVVAVLQ